MKKFICICLAFALALGVCACHSHNWQEATCLAPRTCRDCGKTEGELADHTWVEATYTAPKTCSVCGKTEGMAKVPDFDSKNLKTGMAVGRSADYVTDCLLDHEKQTVGKAVISSYDSFEYDDTHQAKEGYQWRCATISITFSDNNAREFGVRYRFVFEDYYDIKLHDDTYKAVSAGEGTYKINFDGKEQDVTIRRFETWNEWSDGSRTLTIEFSACVPTGYDGVVIGLINAHTDWAAGKYINDVADNNTLLFRMA